MHNTSLPRHLTIEKHIGETPLEAAERLRAIHHISKEVPLAYAGRLDPMAEGKLLILVGDECKKQKNYHTLDKEYEFTVLFGVSSDSGDILGIVKPCATNVLDISKIKQVARSLYGPIALPYPHFSSKTVQGKPLHVWTLEGRLDEIEVPVKHSHIHSLQLQRTVSIQKDELLSRVYANIDSITPVTESSKALGRDFRRVEVRAAWKEIEAETKPEYHLATFSCIASSGTYMRTLAEVIAKKSGTCGLAYGIKRKTIGRYQPLLGGYGFWSKRY